MNWLTVAVILLVAGYLRLDQKHMEMETELEIMASKGDNTDKVLSLEEKLDKADEEIESIINRLNDIAEDIGKLDKGCGVSWASEYKCREEEEHE